VTVGAGPAPEPPPARVRRGRGDRTREAILDAAEALLKESGSEDAVSIRAVAERVGVTAPSIYRHVPDKAHLLFEVCARQFDRLHEEVVVPVVAQGLDPLEAVLRIGRGYVRFGIENPETYRIMLMGHADHTPQQYADERILDGGALGTTVGLVQAAMDAGRVRTDAGDAVTVTWVLWTVLHGIVATAVAKPNMPGPAVDDQVESAFTLLLRGLAPT
jgi:AcrR family transcriptional regulator